MVCWKRCIYWQVIFPVRIFTFVSNPKTIHQYISIQNQRKAFGLAGDRRGVYRITQEALNNAIKHACAHQVIIHLDGSKLNKLYFSIKDDGIGFVPGTDRLRGKSEDGGFGMNTMRERTEELGGQIQIISAPGKGTTVEVTIPFKDAGI